MEFPDQVASNPSLPLALAADPCCVDGAGPVALACLLTSPAIPAAIAETIMRLIRGSRRNPTWDWSGTERSRIVEEYLDAWRAAGSKLLAVDVSAIVPFANDVPAEVERMTRGQALLARRLGWPGCSSWYTHCDGMEPLVRVHRPAEEDQVSELQIFWARWSSVGESECDWTVHPDAPSHARVSWSKEPGQADVTICLDPSGTATASILFTLDVGDQDHWDLPLEPAAVKAAADLFASLGSVAEAGAPGSFAVAIDGSIAVGDVGQVKEGLNCALDLNGPGRDEDCDEDDEPADDEQACEGGETPPPGVELVTFVRKLGPMEAAWFAADGGAPLLECLDCASAALGAQAPDVEGATAQACQSAFERLIPSATAQTAGREALSSQDGRREADLAICDGKGTLILGFFGFRWCSSCEEHEIQLDAVVPVPR